jgi:hypothetical protein
MLRRVVFVSEDLSASIIRVTRITSSVSYNVPNKARAISVVSNGLGLLWLCVHRIRQNNLRKIWGFHGGDVGSYKILTALHPKRRHSSKQFTFYS